MTTGERRVALSLVSVISVRMLGLFMILPVFAVYARDLEGYTGFLAGVAIGIYGLTQGLFQIPMGMLSDRWGRKPIIITGLLVFAFGSVVAAMSTSIYGVILGRALQGMGAISSAVMALAADLTREEQRMKMMAMIGMSIGASFMLALIIGPVLHGWFGLTGIFWMTTVLALAAILIVMFRVPTPVVSNLNRDAGVEPGWFRKVIKDSQLLRLDAGVLILHMIMTATFMAVPRFLDKQFNLALTDHWRVYLPVLILSIILILPFIILAERKRMMKQVLVTSVIVLSLACLGLYHWHQSLAGMVMLLVMFFAAFNLLEASLPSLVAKTAPAAHKGTAMGVFSSSQFMGAFLGGAGGGWLGQTYGLETVFLGNAVLAGLWLFIAVTMRQPRYLSSYTLQVGRLDEVRARELVSALTAVKGVAEAVVIPEDGVAYLKVDKGSLDQEALCVFSVS
ncbi:MAG: MFS transporter [Gammaproteobacteria bacterium]|nr:MFS transporter [Gammaproteobacteria bacterium]MDH5651186.1 MFS transporter [Gammaproteobacteria bacterium]